jgi:hypothetical protein
VPWWTWARIPWLTVAQRQVAVEHQRGRHRAGAGEHVARGDVAPLDADEIDGDALARVGALDGLVVICTERTRTAGARRRRTGGRRARSPRPQRARATVPAPRW